MIRNFSLALAFVLTVATAGAQQAGPAFPLLDGKTAPLTLKLKDLDPNWRVFTAASGSYQDLIASAMGGGGSRVYTKGDTITVGSEVFLVTYKPDALNMASMFAGGGPPKPKPLTADTVLRLSLLNLHALSSMDGIRVFDLKDQLVAENTPPAFPESPPAPTASTASAAEPALLKDGTKAPDFVVHDDKGNPVKLSSYRGKVVVVDFWATWCGPCQESLPKTNALAAKYTKKGVVFLGVNVWDEKKAFHSWLPDHKSFSSIKFAIDTRGQGQDVATKLYNVSGIPTQYVIDRRGRIVESIVGYSEDESELKSGIDRALAKS